MARPRPLGGFPPADPLTPKKGLWGIVKTPHGWGEPLPSNGVPPRAHRGPGSGGPNGNSPPNTFFFPGGKPPPRTGRMAPKSPGGPKNPGPPPKIASNKGRGQYGFSPFLRRDLRGKKRRGNRAPPKKKGTPPPGFRKPHHGSPGGKSQQPRRTTPPSFPPDPPKGGRAPTGAHPGPFSPGGGFGGVGQKGVGGGKRFAKPEGVE